jgi:hypothetical protein
MEMFMVLMVNGNVDNYLSIFINGYFHGLMDISMGIIQLWSYGLFFFMLLRYNKKNFIPAI